MSEAITITEGVRLEKLEAIIQRGLSNFVEVGEALLEIRDSKLYRDTHGTFETYCREKWGMTQQYATQLCRSAAVAVMLKSETIVSPGSEGQARPLTQLDTPEQQREAWTEAQQSAAAAGKPVTAKVVKAAVQTVKARNGTAEPEPSAEPAKDTEDDSGDPNWLLNFHFNEVCRPYWLRVTHQQRVDFIGGLMAAAPAPEA